MSKVIDLGDYAELRRVIREEVRQAVREAMGANVPAVDVVMRMPDVEKATGLKKSTVYELARNGEFPAGFMVGKNARAWLASEVRSWILNRAAPARKEA